MMGLDMSIIFGLVGLGLVTIVVGTLISNGLLLLFLEKKYPGLLAMLKTLLKKSNKYDIEIKLVPKKKKRGK